MIGFGPTVWKRKYGETEYGVKALPLGGYISMAGMFPPAKQGGKPRTASTGFFDTLVQDARTSSADQIKAGRRGPGLLQAPDLEAHHHHARRADHEPAHRASCSTRSCCAGSASRRTAPRSATSPSASSPRRARRPNAPTADTRRPPRGAGSSPATASSASTASRDHQLRPGRPRSSAPSPGRRSTSSIERDGAQQRCRGHPDPERPAPCATASARSSPTSAATRSPRRSASSASATCTEHRAAAGHRGAAGGRRQHRRGRQDHHHPAEPPRSDRAGRVRRAATATRTARSASSASVASPARSPAYNELTVADRAASLLQILAGPERRAVRVQPGAAAAARRRSRRGRAVGGAAAPGREAVQAPRSRPGRHGEAGADHARVSCCSAR